MLLLIVTVFALVARAIAKTPASKHARFGSPWWLAL
jgi:hypothetical protein